MTQWCLTTSGAKVAVYMVVAHKVRDDPPYRMGSMFQSQVDWD